MPAAGGSSKGQAAPPFTLGRPPDTGVKGRVTVTAGNKHSTAEMYHSRLELQKLDLHHLASLRKAFLGIRDPQLGRKLTIIRNRLGSQRGSQSEGC